MNHTALVITGLSVGALLHLGNAAAGAMLPPLPGQERTRYGYWYRLVQKLASNSDRLEAALPALAREIAAEEERPHVINLPKGVDMHTFADGGEIPDRTPFIVGEHANPFPDLRFIVQGLKPNSTQENLMSTAPAAIASASELQKIEKEFVSILEKAGQDFEKGLAFVVKYLPAATTLASLLFPAAAAPLTEASVTATLIQNAIVEVEQKYAASGAQSGTGAQKAADVLTLVNGAVTTLLADSTIKGELTKAGITVNSTYVSNLISAVVGFLNVQGVAASPSA